MPSRRPRFALPRLEYLEGRNLPAPLTHTWLGGNPGNFWYDPANWSDGAVPVAADTAIFDRSTNGVTLAAPGPCRAERPSRKRASPTSC